MKIGDIVEVNYTDKEMPDLSYYGKGIYRGNANEELLDKEHGETHVLIETPSVEESEPCECIFPISSVKPLEKQSVTESESETEKALKVIREATDGALDESCLLEAVCILISQRDNARNIAEIYRKKLKELGHEFIG